MMTAEGAKNLKLLKDAETALNRLEASKKKYSECASAYKKALRQLSNENKAMENAIATAVRKEREALDENYQGRLEKLDGQLKKANAQKEKAKASGVKRRIKETTAPVNKENRGLSEASRSELKDAGISPVFNHAFFYRLFVPKGARDLLLITCLFLVVGILLPFLIYQLIPNHQLVQLIILVAVFLAVLIIIYVLIRKLTRGKNQGAVIHARRNFDLINANKKKLKALVKSIESDTDESMYKLDSHDDNISSIRHSLDLLNNEYARAKETFENQTRPSMEAEIRGQYSAKIQELEAKVDETRAMHDQAKAELDEADRVVSEDYSRVIGKRYMKIESLAKLQNIIADGAAQTINDAIDVLKTEK